MSTAVPFTMDHLIQTITPVLESLGCAITVESDSVLLIEDLPDLLHSMFGRMEIEYTEEKGPCIAFGATALQMEAFDLDGLAQMLKTHIDRHLASEADLKLTFSERIENAKLQHLEALKEVKVAVEGLRTLRNAIAKDLAAVGVTVAITPLPEAPWAKLHIGIEHPVGGKNVLSRLSPITFIPGDGSTMGERYALPVNRMGFGPAGLSYTLCQIAELTGEYLAWRETVGLHSVVPATTDTAQ